MATLRQIIRQDRHPVWLVDALILSAVAYSNNPQQELERLNGELGLLDTAKYLFLEEEELRRDGFESHKQVLLIVKSLAYNHMIIACRGTTGFFDALTDLTVMQKSLSVGVGAAHAGFLDRAKSIPLRYLRRLLIRGEKIVLTGHSLGGAVASLLTLRLLESTPRWCHEQVQCYTFGCPFFADSTLAKHINRRYKKHFVHIVSKNDIIPKVMPVAHTLYTIWAGLEAGPLQDLFNISQLVVLLVQVLTRMRRHRLGVVTVATQAVSWLPGMIRGLIHRLLALALSYHSGSGYAFAGQMVLLDSEKSFLGECNETEDLDVEKHLAFQLTSVSMDGMKEHSLLSYIESVFYLDSTFQQDERESDSPLEVHSTTVNVTVADSQKMKDLSTKRLRLTEIETPASSSSSEVSKERRLKTLMSRKQGPGPTALRSKVACIIFAKRMQESSPTILKRKQRQKEKKKPIRIVYENVGRLARIARRLDTIFLASSIYCVVTQFRRFYSTR
eukprot:Gb_10602 [translate_table: standard]